MTANLNDIRNLYVTGESLDRYLEGNYPAFLELHMNFLQTILANGDVSKQQVALEILSMLYQHKMKRISIEDTIELLPEAWQGDVVPVPVPVLEALMLSYFDYSRDPENSTIGAAWGLESQGTTGKRRSATNLKARKKDLLLALEIEQLYHLEKFQGKSVTAESIIQESAVRRGVSESRARKAYERFKAAAREYLSRLQLFSDN